MARGRPPGHTRDQVVEAAIRLADEEGLAAVTIRRVASSIGAGAMSLYTYVADKDRLLDLMVDRVSASTRPTTITGDWRADLLALAGAQRELMLAHPWLPAALPHRRLTGRHMLAHLEQGLAALAPTGLGGSTKMEVIALVTGFVASFVTNELAAADPPPDQVALITSALATGEFPHLAAALAESAAAAGNAEGADNAESAAGAEVAVPSFERIAAWTITGLVEQASRA